MGLGPLDDPCRGLHQRVAARFGADAVIERDRQVRRADEDAVYALDPEDVVERIERGAGLDHRDRLGHRVGRAEISGTFEAAQRQHGARAPGPFAKRRKLGEGREPPRVLAAVDHRRDDARGAGVEEAAHQREFTDRRSYDSRLAGQRHRENGPRGADEVEHAVLHVEHDGVEGFARERFGDRRFVR